MQKEREREVGHAQKNSDLTYAALPLPHRRQIVVIQIIRPRAPFEHRETIVLAPRKSRDEAIGRETRRCSRFHRNHRPRKFMRSGTANLSSSPLSYHKYETEESKGRPGDNAPRKIISSDLDVSLLLSPFSSHACRMRRISKLCIMKVN